MPGMRGTSSTACYEPEQVIRPDLTTLRQCAACTTFIPRGVDALQLQLPPLRSGAQDDSYKDGHYRVHFSAPHGASGVGLIKVDQGVIHGAESKFSIFWDGNRISWANQWPDPGTAARHWSKIHFWASKL